MKVKAQHERRKDGDTVSRDHDIQVWQMFRTVSKALSRWSDADLLYSPAKRRMIIYAVDPMKRKAKAWR